MQDEPVPEVDIDALAQGIADGVFVLDVRQPDEFAAGHVPGAVLIPLDELGARSHEVPADRSVYVVCASGARSAVAVQALRRAGYDAANVTGGTRAWIDAGRAVDR